MNKQDFFYLCIRYLSPELSQQLADIYGVFIENDIDAIENDISLLQSREELVDRAVFPSMIVDTILVKAISLLEQEGVFIHDNVTNDNILIYVVILNNHFAIKNLEDKSDILNIIDGDKDRDNIDIYYEILTSISELGTEDYYEYVSGVASDLIDGIRDICTQEDIDDDPDFEVRSNFDDFFVKFYKKDPVTKQIISEYFDLNTPTTYTLESMLKEDFIKDIYFSNDQYSTEDLATALFVFTRKSFSIQDGVIVNDDIDNHDLQAIAKVASVVDGRSVSEILVSIQKDFKSKLNAVLAGS